MMRHKIVIEEKKTLLHEIDIETDEDLLTKKQVELIEASVNGEVRNVKGIISCIPDIEGVRMVMFRIDKDGYMPEYKCFIYP